MVFVWDLEVVFMWDHEEVNEVVHILVTSLVHHLKCSSSNHKLHKVECNYSHEHEHIKSMNLRCDNKDAIYIINNPFFQEIT